MEMTVQKDWKMEMAKLKRSLEWGDQRRIADLLDLGRRSGLNKVNLALNGYVDDPDFLTKLVAAAQKIQKARKKYAL